jgi:monoamine oxidase
VFWCKQLIAGLPLGILQQEKVKFTPSLPQEYTELLKKMGNAAFNKVHISFEQPFWGDKKGWISFITKGKDNLYPIAYTVPEIDKHTLCLFVSGDSSFRLSKMTDEEVSKDFLRFLGGFIKEEVKVTACEMTRWQEDVHALGSYSYQRVGQRQEEWTKTLRSPIGGRIWLIGEHLHPTMSGCAHGAHETGVWAAEELLKSKSAS